MEPILIAVLGFGAAIITLLSVLLRQTQKIHVLVNSRLTSALRNTALLKQAMGLRLDPEEVELLGKEASQ